LVATAAATGVTIVLLTKLPFVLDVKDALASVGTSI
jgi:hypothetical protein